MSQPPKIAEENHIAFFFETNRPVPAEAFGVFLSELSRIARLPSHFGPEAEVEIASIGSGTIWVDIAVAVSGQLMASSITYFAVRVAARMRSRRGKLAAAVSSIYENGNVNRAHIITNEHQIWIERREIRAQPLLSSAERRRRLAASVRRPPTVHSAEVVEVLKAGDETDAEIIRAAIPSLERGKLRKLRRPLWGPLQTVHFRGVFTETDSGQYLFKREDGSDFKVVTDELEEELPLGEDLFVTGSVPLDNEMWPDVFLPARGKSVEMH